MNTALTQPAPARYGGVLAFTGRLGRFARRQPLGMAGLLIVLLLLILAAFGAVLAPHDPAANSADVLRRPNAQYWFGTDNYGRDYLSRTIVGARLSITIAVASMVLGMSAGTILGMMSAYFAGWFDMLFQRVVDALLALPFLILAMLFVTVFGSSVINLSLVLGIAITPAVIRVSRASAFGVLSEPYVDAARIVGAGWPRMLARHVLPNILASIMVVATTGIGSLILAEAGLSFLGLGIAPPASEWGQMLSESRAYALQAPWLAIFPGAAVSLAVLGFNLFGDAVRDVWDPRLRIG